MADTTEAVEYLTAFAALVERPPRDDLQVEADVGDKVAAHLRALLSERTALLERVERAERESAHLRLQAQSWACEAKTANATINESYQAITGATGEPGNWNGAEPVKALIARAQAAETKLATLTVVLERLEAANEAVAASRTHDIYLAMIVAGQSADLLSLDEARAEARAALSQTQEEKTNG